MNSDQAVERLIKRLEIIIILLLESSTNGATSTSQKIERLLGFGLSNSEVASLIGKPMNYVTAVTSAKKKKQRKTRS